MYKLLSFCTLFIFCASGWAADEGATPEEIVDKTKEAANYLEEQGETGLDVFNQQDSEWVWKDTYVFIYDCEQNVMAAHPIKPELAGKSLDEIKDEEGKSFFSDLCEAGKQPNGGWVEYMWTKPGEEGAFRKISYALQAGDGPYQAGAGVYDDSLTVDELNAMVQ